MKVLGVEWLISVSAVGSLKEKYAPRDIVVPDQFYDRTPPCRYLFRQRHWWRTSDSPTRSARELSARSWRTAPGSVGRQRSIEGGTYVCMEGPQFSTRAESNLYRSAGAST